MPEISKLMELRTLLLDMERAMGLQELSTVERDIYYAASDHGDPSTPVKTTTLQDHALLADVSRPTFFRALKSLQGKGYLEQCKDSVRGYYIVKSPGKVSLG